MSNSVFLVWFEAQYGKRPGGAVGDFDLICQRDAGRRAEMLLKERSEYDACCEASLRAWHGARLQVKDADKSVRGEA